MAYLIDDRNGGVTVAKGAQLGTLSLAGFSRQHDALRLARMGAPEARRLWEEFATESPADARLVAEYDATTRAERQDAARHVDRLLAKSERHGGTAGTGAPETPPEMVRLELPADVSVALTPADLATIISARAPAEDAARGYGPRAVPLLPGHPEFEAFERDEERRAAKAEKRARKRAKRPAAAGRPGPGAASPAGEPPTGAAAVMASMPYAQQQATAEYLRSLLSSPDPREREVAAATLREAGQRP